MATVTYKVVKGDTLSEIAQKYNTTVDNLAKLNNIRNIHLIYVGQVLTISGAKPSTSSSSTSSSASSPTKATITAFGVQSTTERTLFATWSWSRANTDKYKWIWTYSTGNGVWFVGNESEGSFDGASPQSVYTAPDNAISVQFKVKPISKTKRVNDVDTYYWTASWSDVKTYNFDGIYDVPSISSATIDDYNLTVIADNLSFQNGTQIEFEVSQGYRYLMSRGISNIQNNAAIYKCKVIPSWDYYVRCRAKRNGIYGEWSEYFSAGHPKPSVPPSGITSCVAASETSIKVAFGTILSADSYDIEYTEDRNNFGASSGSTIVNNITQSPYTISGLESGKRYFLRLRAVNDKGTSGWTSDVSVVLGSKPEAPTTWSSVNVGIVGESILLYWCHNSEDNSNETSAELMITINGSSELHVITDEDVEDDSNNYYTLNTSGMSEGAIVKWKVRTAGVTGEYGEWSTERMINVYAPATLSLSITNKNNSVISTITEFPFYIVGIAGPDSQTPLSYNVTITSNESYETVDEIGNTMTITNGQEIYSKSYDIDTDLLLQITPSSLQLENNISYKLKCLVAMDSGLSVEEEIDFDVTLSESKCYPNAEIVLDEDTLSAYIHPYCDDYPAVYYQVSHDATNNTYTRTSTVLAPLDGTSVDEAFTTTYDDIVYTGTDSSGNTVLFCVTVSELSHKSENITLSIYRREFDGTFLEIATDIPNSDNIYITDPHPSLDYARYRIVAVDSTNGSVSYTDIPGYYVGCKSIIIQWEEKWSEYIITEDDPLANLPYGGSILKLPYNIDVSDSNSLDVSLVEYIGRRYPISYYGTHVGSVATWKTEIPAYDSATLYGLRLLSIYMGDVYVREPSGSGYWANVSVQFDQTHCKLTIPVTMQLTRVMGGI